MNKLILATAAVFLTLGVLPQVSGALPTLILSQSDGCEVKEDGSLTCEEKVEELKETETSQKD